jgi:hypothetical protein
MTEQQFAYWLQGFAELCPDAPTAEQWQSIREHLATVFNKVTPPVKVTVKLPEVGESQAIKDLIEKARKERVIEPPHTPYQPYSLEQGILPGTLIC